MVCSLRLWRRFSASSSSGSRASAALISLRSPSSFVLASDYSWPRPATVRRASSVRWFRSESSASSRCLSCSLASKFWRFCSRALLVSASFCSVVESSGISDSALAIALESSCSRSSFSAILSRSLESCSRSFSSSGASVWVCSRSCCWRLQFLLGGIGLPMQRIQLLLAGPQIRDP